MSTISFPEGSISNPTTGSISLPSGSVSEPSGSISTGGSTPPPPTPVFATPDPFDLRFAPGITVFVTLVNEDYVPYLLLMGV